MTRFIVEYRRRSTWDNEWGGWTIYSQGTDEKLAMDAYCRHVSNYPHEQARLAIYPFEPQEIRYEFDPTPEEDAE
jgi:hypothetical protein